MNSQDFSIFLTSHLDLNILLIILGGFLGSIIGEFKKTCNDNKRKKIYKKRFISSFLASWLIAVILSILLNELLSLNNKPILFAISGIFGYDGYSNSMSYISFVLESKFNIKKNSENNQKEKKD